MTEATDFASAARRFRKLADQGDAKGQSDLATLYQNGLGVPQDYAEALRLYRLAADQGNAFAQSNLGVMYASGQGVPQNYGEAAHWYRRAADQGLATAQHNLGFMYAHGQGVSQNYVEAVRLYRLIADQGNADGQTALGFMYANGQGVSEDYVLAYMWCALSAAQGNQLAENNRNLFAGQMTPVQIAEAQKLAREWKPTALRPGYTDPSGKLQTPQTDAAVFVFGMVRMQIQDYFCRSSDGISCRIADYGELKKRYALGDLVREVEGLLEYEKAHPLIILRAFSYVYLHAYFFYELKEIEDILQKGTKFISGFEKATAPRFFSLRSRRAPENLKETYDSFKKQVPVLDEARPLVRFNLERADNYDLYAKIIRDNTHRLDYLLSSIDASVPPVIFFLLHYMDTVVVPWKQQST